jgi:FkbM family methyltransferase
MLYWVIFLLCAALIGTCWLLYRTFVQNGRTLLRLQEVEGRLGTSSSPEELLARWRQLFHPINVNSKAEFDYIVFSVLGTDEYKIMQQRFEPGDVVIDVGANIGSFTLLCHILGCRAIFSFEPGEINFQSLKANAGSLPGVHIFQTAVWRSDINEDAKLTLAEDSINSGAHSVMGEGQVVGFSAGKLVAPARPAYAVSSLPLDAILERFNRVKLLKLDCEGSEFPILLTSQKLDRVNRIVGEIHEVEKPFMGALGEQSRIPGVDAFTLNTLVARLESFGFRVAIRPGEAHMYWFDARRANAAGEVQEEKGSNSTGLRS